MRTPLATRAIAHVGLQIQRWQLLVLGVILFWSPFYLSGLGRAAEQGKAAKAPSPVELAERITKLESRIAQQDFRIKQYEAALTQIRDVVGPLQMNINQAQANINRLQLTINQVQMNINQVQRNMPPPQMVQAHETYIRRIHPALIRARVISGQ